MRRPALALVIASAALAWPARADPPPDAQPASDPAGLARQRYNAGVQAYAAKRFVEAALDFEAAAALRPNGVALYTAGLAWEQANEPARAADAFARCIEIPGLGIDKLTAAKERLSSLETTLGAVLVTGVDGARAQLDDHTEAPVPARLHGTPGVHALTVHAPARDIEKREVVLEVAQTKNVDTSSAPTTVSSSGGGSPPAPPPTGELRPSLPPLESSSGVPLRRSIGIGVAGLGVGALLGGVVLGLEALDARDAYNTTPTQAGLDHANGLATWTTVALISGGVLTAGGLALVLWPASKGASTAHLVVTPSPGGASLSGAW
jgi:hypothetical protein